MTQAVRSAISSGIILILWSLITYFISETRSLTAFIPAIFGVIIGTFGVIATKENRRKHAMHGAALFGLLGALFGLGMGIPKVISDPGRAAYSQLFLGIVCLFLVVTCVRSFIAARRGA